MKINSLLNSQKYKSVWFELSYFNSSIFNTTRDFLFRTPPEYETPLTFTQTLSQVFGELEEIMNYGMKLQLKYYIPLNRNKT